VIIMATFEEFKSEIEVVLGGNLVSVELEDIDYQTALKRAIRKYKQYGANNYLHGYVKVEVAAHSASISVPANVDTVVKIIRPYAASDFFTSEDLFVRKAIDEMFISRGRKTGCGGFDFLQYEFLQQEQERLKRYAATDVDFSHNKWDSTLTLYNKPVTDETWFAECYLDLEDELYMDLGWVVEWSRAECLEILGRAYSKFSSIAAPTGETSLDGRSMIQEAQEIKRGLMEDIENNVSGDVDWFGVYIG